MKKLKRKDANKGIVPSVGMIPEGMYISVITDSYTAEIDPVSKDKDLVHVMVHSLINLENFRTYYFYETISPYKGVTRTEAFIEILKSYDLDFFPDDDLIGLVEEIEIVYDFLNGFAVPIISKRRRMFVDEDVDVVRDITLPF